MFAVLNLATNTAAASVTDFGSGAREPAKEASKTRTSPRMVETLFDRDGGGVGREKPFGGGRN